MIDDALYKSDYPLDIPVKVYGYTDSVGDSAYNRKLSVRRAEAAKQYLLERGVPATKITLVLGMGESERRSVQIERGEVPAAVTPTAPQRQLAQIKKGESLVWEHINFEPGKATFLEEAREPLEALAETLKSHPEIVIRLEGHTCCRNYPPNTDGSDDEDILLSTERARQVYRYLISRGINARRLSYHGYGGFRPLVPVEVTDADRVKNRRVEVRVLAR